MPDGRRCAACLMYCLIGAGYALAGLRRLRAPLDCCQTAINELS